MGGFETVRVPHFGASGEVDVRVFARGGTRGSFTVLCVHGFGDNLHTWQELRPILERCGARFLAIDLPGFGRTPLPAAFARHYGIQTVELVHHIGRSLGSGPTILVGNSLGGAISLGAMVRAGDRADGPSPWHGAVLLSPATPRTRTPIFARLLRVPTYRWIDELSQRIPDRPRHGAVRAAVRVALRMMLAPGHRAPRPWVDSVVAAWERSGAFRDMETIAREILSVLRGRKPEVLELLEDLEGVATPVSIVRGTLDPLVGHGELLELAERLPRGRYVAIPGVGHCPQNEATQRTADIVLETLEQAGSVGDG